MVGSWGRGAGTALLFGMMIVLFGGMGGARPAGAERFRGLPAAEARLKAAARERKIPYPLVRVRLRCWKKRRVLELLSGDTVVRSYRVALGFEPNGHKRREGDGRTPEGEYWISTRNDRSRFHLFLGISYPGAEDARAAFARGEIDAETRARIEGVEPPACPPWKTPLGGEVGLHGGGGARCGDWTAGCIALEDDEIDELWVACPLGTPIEIRP